MLLGALWARRKFDKSVGVLLGGFGAAREETAKSHARPTSKGCVLAEPRTHPSICQVRGLLRAQPLTDLGCGSRWVRGGLTRAQPFGVGFGWDLAFAAMHSQTRPVANFCQGRGRMACAIQENLPNTG